MLGVNRILLSLFLVVSQSAVALKSDRDQTLKVHADEVEMDFSSGTRIYQGNVSVRQGTIRIIADRIELIYDGEQLETGIATGDRAVFRQRPDNKDHDMVGLGQRIELDEVNNVVTFIGEAELRQAVMLLRVTVSSTIWPATECVCSVIPSLPGRVRIRKRFFKRKTTIGQR